MIKFKIEVTIVVQNDDVRIEDTQIVDKQITLDIAQVVQRLFTSDDPTLFERLKKAVLITPTTMTNPKTATYCILCGCLKDSTHTTLIFKTGFVYVDSVKYNVGVCKIC